MTAPVRPHTAVVDGVVVLDPEQPGRLVQFIAWLRDRQSETRDVQWHGDVDPRLELSLLWHLPPPEDEKTWRAAYRPAMCTYRHGPGFLQVKDLRRAEESARFLLDDAAVIEAFLRCLDPCRWEDLVPAHSQPVRELVAAGLILDVGGHLTTLPSRLRKWPVPSHIA